MNAYEPWLELGLTEVEYWKQRYLETREELEAADRVSELTKARWGEARAEVERLDKERVDMTVMAQNNAVTGLAIAEDRDREVARRIEIAGDLYRLQQEFFPLRDERDALKEELSQLKRPGRPLLWIIKGPNLAYQVCKDPEELSVPYVPLVNAEQLPRIIMERDAYRICLLEIRRRGYTGAEFLAGEVLAKFGGK